MKPKELILVVDDEPIMRKLAACTLENYGYEVLTACDGNEAIDIFKQHHPRINIVLLDLLMPNKSGKETYIEMQELKPGIPVILITGNKVEKDPRVQEILDLGIKKLIEKPYKLPYLVQTVSEILHPDFF